jgi:hypothetical protein
MSWLGVARVFLSWFFIMSFFAAASALSAHGSLDAAHRRHRQASFWMLPRDAAAAGSRAAQSELSLRSAASSENALSRIRSEASANEIAPASGTTAPAKIRPLAVAALADKQSAPEAPPPVHAPSLIQRLEGREGDFTVWLALAVTFFLAGWIGGSIYSRRRERSRRGRLRF